MIKQFSEVKLKDGAIGSVMDVYTTPYEAYDVDIGSPDPSVPLPKDFVRTVTPDEIDSVLWEPKD
ncbi:MAG: hypothetical protein PHI27_08750 [Eubacteriales bacterium]|nr:hypothetical protein [Eubacteriales bacterium]MDD3882328.1 hypothetical protein [Eubacteriales bacterium]MDD4512074.1 hypothetical protein [Eubacteriales bacterium]